MSSTAQPATANVAAAPPEPAAATRLLSAGLATALRPFEDPALLEAGGVSLIALDAVVARFGDRWPLRRAQVYDHVERTLARHCLPHGYFHRISETDFLVCQPELGRFSAQAACLRYLREILNHFLGDAAGAEECVHQVTKIAANSVTAQGIDPGRVLHGEAAERAEAARAAQAERDSEAGLRRVDQWSPFVASDGREIRVSCTLEPVFELKGFGRIGFRMARRVLVAGSDDELTPAMMANLSRSDLLRIDLATIARGMDRLRAEADGERSPSLIVPVSFSSLTSRDARAQVVALLKEAAVLVRRGVICEVCDIEGAPEGALLDAVSLIRPFSLLVVGRLGVTPPAPATISALKGAGLQALSLECPRGLGEAEFTGWARATIEAARRVTKSVLIYRNASARRAGLVGLMGASHASVRG